MTPTTALLIMLAAATALNSVAVAGLIRQVGVLHLRVQPVPALSGAGGPPVGSALPGGTAVEAMLPPDGSAAQVVVVAFVSPTCNLCRPLLSALTAIARESPPDQAVVVVSDASHDHTGEYLRRHGVQLPFVADESAFKENGIPGAPFVVVCDASWTVLASGGVNTLEQIESLVEDGRSATQAMSHATAAGVPVGA